MAYLCIGGDLRTAPLRYSLRSLQDKDTLTEAMNNVRQKQIEHVVGHESEIRAVYAHVTNKGAYLEAGLIDGDPISGSASREAADWVYEFDRI